MDQSITLCPSVLEVGPGYWAGEDLRAGGGGTYRSEIVQ